ncbi:hypothetical protein PENTCL1PPCAC_1722 [Pristionchus entomophagus]|uniref:Uncharacterized protein n=1 Tax=Pristionchus entomophagus TaxID=358040 RepID=A0AAV5SAW4_9BILA|nr:hypothetical protein PENTCL1PPCAC_1722 [Pristionchus entomophagus]
MTDPVMEARARHASTRARQQTQQAPAQQTQMDFPDESLPTGAEAVNILGAVRDTRAGLSSSRRLFLESDQQASSSSQMLPVLPPGQTLLADRFTDRLVPCFMEVAQGLEALDKTKAVLTEWETRFGDASYADKQANARMLSLQDARDLYCAELQNSEHLEKKVGLLSKRCGDLEKKLRNAETYAKMVFDVYYDKTHSEVTVLLSEVRAKELELLGRVEKAERDSGTLREHLETVNGNLRETEKREEAAKKELADTMAAYRTTAEQQQKAAAQVETARGENARLSAQVQSLVSQLSEMTERERQSRVESSRYADTARSARESEERKIAEMTREANRKIKEYEQEANANVNKARAEYVAEYKIMKTREKAMEEQLRREKDINIDISDRLKRREAEIVGLKQSFQQRLDEERAELQKHIASSYRGMMSDIAPARRIGDEENLGPLGQLWSSRRRDPSPLPERRRDPSPMARPPSRGPPAEPSDEKRMRLRQPVTTTFDPRR